MRQVGRTLTAADEGGWSAHRVLICDRDTKWSAPVRARLGEAGIRVVQTPYQAPNANAYAERFVRSIKEECLNRVIPFGERHLRRTIAEYVEHYHRERNHQGLDNDTHRGAPPVESGHRIRRRQRLGGLLNYYVSRSVMRREDRFDGSAQRWDITDLRFSISRRGAEGRRGRNRTLGANAANDHLIRISDLRWLAFEPRRPANGRLHAIPARRASQVDIRQRGGKMFFAPADKAVSARGRKQHGAAKRKANR